MEAFQDFLEAAHERGIRVILDMVLNHTSIEHPWFLESSSSLTNPKRDWYIWRDGRDRKDRQIGVFSGASDERPSGFFRRRTLRRQRKKGPPSQNRSRQRLIWGLLDRTLPLLIRFAPDALRSPHNTSAH